MASGDNNNGSSSKDEIEEDVDMGYAEVRRLGEETVEDVITSATRSLNPSVTSSRQDDPEDSYSSPFSMSKDVSGQEEGATLDDLVDLSAESLKEHDVAEEEVAEASRIQSELAKELEENGGWVKILGNDELMKKVIAPGAPHQNPTRGDLCTLRLEGRLASDESIIFLPEQEIDIQLGDSEVIPGLDLTIPLMTRGEVATVKVSSRFGFGSKGDPPTGVPPNSNLIFQVQLLSSAPEPELGDLSVTERRCIGNRKRERGNYWYGRGEASLAVNCYRRALEFLDEVEGGIQFPTGGSGGGEAVTPEVRQLFDDRLKTLNNLAMAQLKLQSYEPALTSVEAVLKCQPNNVKALFRKGKILGEKLETEEALAVLNKAKSLEPDDASIAAEIAKLTGRRAKEHQSEKQLYRRMFKKEDASKSEDEGGAGDGTSGGGGRSKVLSSLTMGVMLSGAAIAVAGVMAYRYNHRFL